MKKQTILAIFISLAIGLMIGAWINMPQENDINTVDAGEYQVTLEDDGAYIYDGERFVGHLPFDSTSTFDKLMIKDNE